MELYFSRHRVAPDDVDFAEPGKQWIKEPTLYQKHNLHGEHQVPCAFFHRNNRIRPLHLGNQVRFAFGLVNGSPTTATGTETLQLVPCDELNLELFLNKLQSQPFCIEVAGTNFALHPLMCGSTLTLTSSDLATAIAQFL